MGVFFLKLYCVLVSGVLIWMWVITVIIDTLAMAKALITANHDCFFLFRWYCLLMKLWFTALGSS